MISGASKKELDIANARADLLLEIQQLKQENQKLKETLKNNSKINIADHKYASEMEDKYLTEHNILTEFEKWLKERYKQQTKTLKKMEEDNIERSYVKSRRYLVEECLDKLQELKGNHK